MPGLTPIGNLTYNGITFDGALEISVHVEAVLDDARRTIMYHRHVIRAHAIVTNTGGTDNDMDRIRTALLEPAGNLTFVGKGFGNDLTVGPGDDVMNGPMPNMLSWTPIGANKACEFDWECVVCVAKCMGQAQRQSKGIMAMNYELDFSVDDQGLTTRTITGYIQIAQGRNGRRIRDTAEAYFDRLVVPLADGYRRQQSRHLSKDKSRIDFTLTDSQIPSNNPYPPYAPKIRGRHRSRWQRGPMGTALLNSINIDFSPTLGISGTQAWVYFIHLLGERLKLANAGGNRVLVDGLEADEDLFGLPCGFSVSYRIINKGGINGKNAMTDMVTGLVDIPGLWTPLDTNWTQWKASLSDVFASRGLSGMKHTVADDIILDLCDQGGSPTISGPTKNPPKPTKKKAPYNPYYPSKENSYLSYRNIVTPSANRPVVRQAVTQPPDQQGTSPGDQNQEGYPTFERPSGIKDILQEGGQSRYFISLQGAAERAGYAIGKPVLKAAIGSTIPAGAFKQVGCVFNQVVRNSSFGVPVYSAAWIIDYMLTGTPGQVYSPKNLAEGTGDV